MRERIDRFTHLMGSIVPDAVTTSVFLLVVLLATAFILGDPLQKTMDAYYQGLWMLLPFTMQMTLIITLSTVLGSTPFFYRGIIALSRAPRTENQVLALSILIAAAASYLYWGLGMAVTPLVAVHFAKEAERKGMAIDFPFLLAILWAANSCWQYGLSASAPLLMATPGHFLEKLTGVVPLAKTIWSPAALIQEAAFVILLIAAGRLMMPKKRRLVSEFSEALATAEEPKPDQPASTFSEGVERSSLVTAILCIALGGWLYVHFFNRRMSLDINSLNTVLLLLCLLLHGNVYRFTNSLRKAVLSAWPVIVLYHLYAGVAGVIQHTSIGGFMAQFVASVSTPLTLPLLVAVSGAVVSTFVPSSGGQWAIQGFVTSKAAMEVGISVPRGILALSVGDHVGNLTSPFWYAVVGGMARVNFREFFGYGLIFGAVWFILGVVVFTFAPC